MPAHGPRAPLVTAEVAAAARDGPSPHSPQRTAQPALRHAVLRPDMSYGVATLCTALQHEHAVLLYDMLWLRQPPAERFRLLRGGVRPTLAVRAEPFPLPHRRHCIVLQQIVALEVPWRPCYLPASCDRTVM